MNPLFSLKQNKGHGGHDALLLGLDGGRIRLQVALKFGFYGVQFKVPFHLRAALLQLISERMR